MIETHYDSIASTLVGCTITDNIGTVERGCRGVVSREMGLSSAYTFLSICLESVVIHSERTGKRGEAG